MNKYQFAFLATFVSTFAVLYLTTRFINSKLLAAGYDFTDLILIGLPKDPARITHRDTPAAKMSQSFQLPFIGQVTLDGTTAQVLALTLAIISSVFFYVKFAHKRRKPVLDPAVWQEFPLKEKIVISPNTAIYRFALPHPEDVLGLPIGQHISIQAEINGKQIMRSYTPTSSDDDLGHFDLLIKAYEKGNISRYVSLLKLGDKIRVKGPKGQFVYNPSLSREIGMIAGGTGITPMLQIIRAALKNPFDRTKLSLIYANVNEEDILLRKELDELVDTSDARLKVHYVLNNPPAGWTGSTGFVTKEHIKEHLPASDANIKILLCGPPPMMTVMKKYLDELKYPAPRTVSKLVDQVFLF